MGTRQSAETETLQSCPLTSILSGAERFGPVHETMAESLSYKDAGVDIDAGDALVDRIKPQLAKRGVVVTREVLKQQADRTLV